LQIAHFEAWVLIAHIHPSFFYFADIFFPHAELIFVVTFLFVKTFFKHFDNAKNKTN
jgi:hypothetical protein